MDLTGRTNGSSLPFANFTKRGKGRSPNLLGGKNKGNQRRMKLYASEGGKRGFSVCLFPFSKRKSKEIFFSPLKIYPSHGFVERAREQRA